jgi:hypothetical protein
MPIYEDHFLECGATFEKIVSLNIGVDGFREAPASPWQNGVAECSIEAVAESFLIT